MFSFEERRKVVDIFPYIRRLCDVTTPNLTTSDAGRTENRYNRTIPTLLSPWYDGRALADESIVGLTGDIANRGISLVSSQPFHGDSSVVVGYWVSTDEMSEPWFFLGDVRHNVPIGGGFWKIGVELTEFANTNNTEGLADLQPLAAQASSAS